MRKRTRRINENRDRKTPLNRQLQHCDGIDKLAESKYTAATITKLWERGGRVDGKKKTGCVAVSPGARRGKTAPRVIRVQLLEFQREQATLNGISRIDFNNQQQLTMGLKRRNNRILGGWQNGHRNRAVCRVERRVCWDGFTARKAVMRSVRVVESSSRDE